MKSMLENPRAFDAKQDGAVLIVVLSLVTAISVIVVALAVTMRLERQTSHLYAERTRADFMAREGVEYIKSALSSGSAAIDPQRTSITMPGKMVSWSNNGSGPVKVEELTSGSATGLDAFNLNRLSVSGDSRAVISGSSGEAPAMHVQWIYVFEDGFRSLDLAHKTISPVVGRFAYWADDETARIDFNTAWKQADNPNAPGNPSKVNLLALDTLTQEEADLIHSTAQQHPYNSPDEVRRLDEALAAKVSANRFAVGFCSIAPNLNPWGEPKLVLTTQKANLPAGTTDFLDILTTDNSDPGKIGNLSASKVNAVVNRIYDAMKRTDWPYHPGKSFVDKYGDRKAAQIALNIVEYVRSVESADLVVEPVRARYANSKFEFQSSGNEMLGNTRRPLISEFGVWVPPVCSGTSGGKPFYNIEYKIEFYLPPNSGIDQIDLADLSVYLTLPYTPDKEHTLPSTILKSGQCGCVTVTEPYSVPAGAPRPTEIEVRYTVSPVSDLKRLDLAPMGRDSQGSAKLVCVVDPPGVALDKISSWKIDDIYANKHGTNWSFGPNNFGAPNGNSAVGSASTEVPEQDTDASGKITDVGCRFPNPKGTGNNVAGKIQSLRELGNIHTGVEGYVLNAPSVSWRTVRFQPQRAAADQLPDWALLELFSLPPSDMTPAALNEKPTKRGCVNLNSGICPFPDIVRSEPLMALLKDNPKVPQEKIGQIAANIVARTLAAGGKSYGSTNGLMSVGEVTELAGVSDEGEASEDQLSGLLDNATVCGNVFRVFSVGQSLKQTSSGECIVQAEKYLVSVIQRYIEPSTNRARCKVLWWKSIPL